MLKKYFNVMYSARRNEILVLDMTGKSIFMLNSESETDLSENILNDDEMLKDYICSNYSEELKEMLTPPVINGGYGNNMYKISLHNYDNEFFYVSANHEQEALDEVVDHLEEKGETGHFYDLNAWFEAFGSDNEDYIVAGNHCYYLNPEHTHIEQINELPKLGDVI